MSGTYQQTMLVGPARDFTVRKRIRANCTTTVSLKNFLQVPNRVPVRIDRLGA